MKKVKSLILYLTVNTRMRSFCLCAFAMLVFGQAFAQDATSPPDFSSSRKGQAYFYWGYNRASYNPSDIHFKGDGYDFTLYDVRAHDLPEEWDAKVYLNPTQLTIPQFNFRIGYFLTDKWHISGGWDHMKYRINEHQQVKIAGQIDKDRSEEYAGTYNNSYITLHPNRFLTVEHTDGFNFVRVGLERREVLYSSKNNKHHVAFNGGVSVGAMMPWTDFTLFGEKNRNFLHLAGYGFSATLGIRFEFFNYGFLQFSNQLGYTHLMDIVLEGRSSARGEQKIIFNERSLVAGAFIPIKRKNK